MLLSRSKTLLFLILAAAFIVSSSINSYAQTTQIPSWVKNTAKWWSEGQVGDSDFVKGIQYLVQQGIVQLPVQANAPTTSGDTHIPSWIKTSAGWWSSGQVSDQDFVKGIQYLVQEKIIQVNNNQSFTISSPAFENNGTIPVQYTCDGNSTSPPLTISGVPQNAQSLALTVVDIDAPRGPFTHWIMWNISPSVIELNGGNTTFPQGLSSAGTHGYKGPCPPSGVHRYFFTLYALDTSLNLDTNTTRDILEQSMTGHVIGKTFMMGTYSRS